MHLDELPDEDPRPGIGLVLEPLDVGHRGTDEVIHELELPSYRHREAGELGGFRDFRCYGELGHPVRVSGPWGRTPEPSVSVRAGWSSSRIVLRPGGGPRNRAKPLPPGIAVDRSGYSSRLRDATSMPRTGSGSRSMSPCVGPARESRRAAGAWPRPLLLVSFGPWLG